MIGIEVRNLFDPAPASGSHEFSEILADSRDAKIERIVSRGQASADDFWYDQTQDEFVLLLKGAAGLEFASPPKAITLRPGDWLVIPAHDRHRVAWTDPDRETHWLVVFL